MVIDLQDDRRLKKPWLPDDDRDVTNGLVTEDGDGKPRCWRHGAMNRVDPHREIYRCSEFRCGVGAEVVTGPVSTSTHRPGPGGTADWVLGDRESWSRTTPRSPGVVEDAVLTAEG